MVIKDYLKRYKFTYFLIKRIRKYQYVYLPYFITISIFNIRRLLRVMRFARNSTYEKLREIKNIHKGERCFIVATGPSLKIEDLEKLKNEVTFSMNSICLAFDETDWRPTYYGIQDQAVYKKFKKEIEKLNAKCTFIADVIWEQNNIPENYYIYPLNLLNHEIHHEKYNAKFSDNAFSAVYDGYSITYSLIQMAVYMGFNDIYLIGADCNYSNDMKHHFKEYGHVDPGFSLARDKMISAYKEAKKYADKRNIKIYNSTRGGFLEVFERVDFDELLEQNKQELIVL